MPAWHCILDPPVPSWGACLLHSHVQSCVPLWSQTLRVAEAPARARSGISFPFPESPRLPYLPSTCF
uniref:Uncharacterized protein n=1 Tax=Mus spicilegus TaxID=10103 RepID=A0A8C6ICH3_MUSSI